MRATLHNPHPPKYRHTQIPLPGDFYPRAIPIMQCDHIRTPNLPMHLSMTAFNRRYNHIQRMTELGLLSDITLN